MFYHSILALLGVFSRPDMKLGGPSLSAESSSSLASPLVSIFTSELLVKKLMFHLYAEARRHGFHVDQYMQSYGSMMLIIKSPDSLLA